MYFLTSPGFPVDISSETILGVLLISSPPKQEGLVVLKEETELFRPTAKVVVIPWLTLHGNLALYEHVVVAHKQVHE